jgi:hypothetical protein
MIVNATIVLTKDYAVLNPVHKNEMNFFPENLLNPCRTIALKT